MAARRRGTQTPMRITMLQWAVGLFCALIGALMITVPEQFDTPAYAAFVPHLTGWGLAFLVAGNGLLAVAIFSPRRTLTIVGHLLAAGVVLALARGFTVPGIWTATCQYAVLGLGTAIAPFIRGPGGPEEWRGGRHLFGLLMGLGAMASGLMFWGFPRQFLAPFYDVVRPHLALYGLIFVGGGGALVFAQLPQLPRWATRVLYPVGGGALLVSLATTALPARYWTGIVYGGAFGLLLVLQPWMGPLLYAIRPSSLRARIALALAVAAAVPLIFAVASSPERKSGRQRSRHSCFSRRSRSRWPIRFPTSSSNIGPPRSPWPIRSASRDWIMGGRRPCCARSPASLPTSWRSPATTPPGNHARAVTGALCTPPTACMCLRRRGRPTGYRSISMSHRRFTSWSWGLRPRRAPRTDNFRGQCSVRWKHPASTTS